MLGVVLTKTPRMFERLADIFTEAIQELPFFMPSNTKKIPLTGFIEHITKLSALVSNLYDNQT
jgi:hypothetical protein